MTIRFDKSNCRANSKASQMEPSLASPSPTMAKTRCPVPLRFAASARPTPTDRPCPSEPELTSSPGHGRRTAPSTVCRRQNSLVNSLSVTQPSSRKQYWAITPWPLLSTRWWRPGGSAPSRRVKMCAVEHRQNLDQRERAGDVHGRSRFGHGLSTAWRSRRTSKDWMVRSRTYSLLPAAWRTKSGNRSERRLPSLAD